MKAITISGGRLEMVERAAPRPARDEVLVEVAGAGVNRADLLQRAGLYPAPPGWPRDVPGLELAGTVAAIGPDVRSLQEGDHVFGIVGGGAQATHALTKESLCARIPANLDPIEAGGAPEAFVTVHDAMVTQAGLKPGERVLIHSVGSGVGTAAVQLARALGATTVGTSRTPEKLDCAAELGLDEGIVSSGNMAGVIGEVDVVLDLVGGDYLQVDVEVCRDRGRIVLVGLIAGSSTKLDLGKVLTKRLRIIGTVLRSRSDDEKAAAFGAFAKEVVPLLAAGTVGPVVDRIVPLAEAQSAYEAVASNATFGKVILAP